MPQLPLFVFGTLRRGHCNHHYLEGRYTRMLRAMLRGHERLHPLMIRQAAGGCVGGELFFLTDRDYDEALAACDELEDIPPGKTAGTDYERRRVTVETEEGELECWAYVSPEGSQG